MKARAMNSKAVVAAAMMMVLVAASVSAASAAGLGNLGQKVTTRTVLKYANGAWTAPTAVVLKSAADWTSWNNAMVASGMAVAAEPVPASVDWKHEAVLVVSLGCCRPMQKGVDLSDCERVALHTDVALNLTYGQGGTYPCVVVAMSRQQASRVHLSNGAEAGLPTDVAVYSAAPAPNAANGAGEQLAASWGAVKGEYRN